MNQIRQANKAAGFHWFDAATMRFFQSRVSSRVYPLADGSCLFVSSERNGELARRYTVRHALTSGDIADTPRGFQAFATSGGAHGYAARLRAELNASA